MFDMKNPYRLKKLDEHAPDSMEAVWAFDRAVFAKGAPTVPQKQLIAVALRSGGAVTHATHRFGG